MKVDHDAGFFSAMNEESLNHEPIYPHQIDHLAGVIRTRIIGVRPEDQDVELYDDDWRLILTALRDLKAGTP